MSCTWCRFASVFLRLVRRRGGGQWLASLGRGCRDQRAMRFGGMFDVMGCVFLYAALRWWNAERIARHESKSTTLLPVQSSTKAYQILLPVYSPSCPTMSMLVMKHPSNLYSNHERTTRLNTPTAHSTRLSSENRGLIYLYAKEYRYSLAAYISSTFSPITMQRVGEVVRASGGRNAGMPNTCGKPTGGLTMGLVSRVIFVEWLSMDMILLKFNQTFSLF